MEKYMLNNPVILVMSDKSPNKTEMVPCPYLDDRVVRGEAINAECNAPNRDACPKVRSTKKAVNRQCWRISKSAIKSES